MTYSNNRRYHRNRRKYGRRSNKYDDMYRTIDGNETYNPYGYCWHHKGYITKKQSLLHRCNARKCPRFEPFKHHINHFRNKRVSR